MPISKYFHGHGKEAMAKMKKQYGEKEGEHVFYATANKKKQTAKDDTTPAPDKTGSASVASNYEEQSAMGVGSHHARVNTAPVVSDKDYGLNPVTALTAAQINENNKKFWIAGGKSIQDCPLTDKMQPKGK